MLAGNFPILIMLFVIGPEMEFPPQGGSSICCISPRVFSARAVALSTLQEQGTETAGKREFVSPKIDTFASVIRTNPGIDSELQRPDVSVPKEVGSLLTVPEIIPGFRAIKTVAKRVWICTFGQECDQDFDRWPDEWVRERSPEFPRHPIAQISAPPLRDQEVSPNVAPQPSALFEAASPEKPSPLPGASYLLIRPQGGAVSLARPLTLKPFTDYLLRVEFQATDIHGCFLIELETLDAHETGNPQKTYRVFLFGDPKHQATFPEPKGAVAEVRGTGTSGADLRHLEAWLHLKADTQRKTDRHAIFRLRVYPASRSHRKGEIRVRSVTLWQIPSMEATVLPANQVALVGIPIEGKICTPFGQMQSGFAEPASGHVLLEDLNGKTVAELSFHRKQPLPKQKNIKEILESPTGSEEYTPETSRPKELSDGNGPPSAGAALAQAETDTNPSELAFQVPPPPPGHYRLVIQLFSANGEFLREEVWRVAILPDLNWEQPSAGSPQRDSRLSLMGETSQGGLRMFGWSMDLTTLASWAEAVAGVLPASGVRLLRWEASEVAFPGFLSSKAAKEVQTLLRSCQAAGISLGVVLSHPGSPHDDFSQRWGKQLEAFPEELLVLTRWLQLGHESHPLCSSQQDAQVELFRLSRSLTQPPPIRELVIPVGEKTEKADPNRSFPPFLRVGTCLYGGWQKSKPNPNSEEPRNPPGTSPGGKPSGQFGGISRRLASIRITPREGRPISELASGIVQAACEAAACDSSWVLLRIDEELLPQISPATGGPGELFLPWWICTQLLHDAKPLGFMPLEVQVTGQLFSRNGQGLLAIWAEQARTIPLTLLHGAKVVDPWGRCEEVPGGADPTPLPVGPLPKFVLCKEVWPLAWQQRCQVESGELLPYPGLGQTVKIQFANPANFPVRGTLRLAGPPGFRVHPQEFRYHLNPGEKFESTLEITVPSHALMGGHSFRWCFRLEEPENTTFSVDRPIQLRWPGLEFGHAKLLPQAGASVFQVELYNKTGNDLFLITELFGVNRKRAALPPQVFPPGVHQIRIPLEEAASKDEEIFILQVREVNGPRRIRVEMRVSG